MLDISSDHKECDLFSPQTDCTQIVITISLHELVKSVNAISSQSINGRDPTQLTQYICCIPSFKYCVNIIFKIISLHPTISSISNRAICISLFKCRVNIIFKTISFHPTINALKI